jgi:hypothetical protein
MFINNLFFKIREIIATSPAKRDWLIYLSLILVGLVNLAGWLIILAYFWQVNDFIVLQYNIYFGISSLGPWPILFFLPASGLIIIMINFALSFWLYLKERLLSYFLAIAALLFQLTILVGVILIVYMNL